MPDNQKPGFVIAIDGPDGVGKTTQLHLLQEYLQKNHANVHVTRASGGTPIGEELRKASLSNHERPAETDLYIALAMYAALAGDLQKRKAQGQLIIIDRSPLSMVAYNAYGSNLPDKTDDPTLHPSKETAMDLCAKYLLSWQIDLLLYLEAPQKVINSRRHARQDDNYFENLDNNYHDRVREGYDAALQHTDTANTHAPIIQTVDADAGIDSIAKKIQHIVREHDL